MCKVTDLKVGDVVDLAGDRYADPQNTVEAMARSYHLVNCVEEEAGWVAVQFLGWGTICFPPHHVIAAKGYVEWRA